MRQPLLQVIGDSAPRRGPPSGLKASAVSSILELRSSRLVQSDLLAVAVATARAVYAGVVFVVKGSCATGTPSRGHRWPLGRRKRGQLGSFRVPLIPQRASYCIAITARPERSKVRLASRALMALRRLVVGLVYVIMMLVDGAVDAVHRERPAGVTCLRHSTAVSSPERTSRLLAQAP
jgi:hypothetical protein